MAEIEEIGYLLCRPVVLNHRNVNWLMMSLQGYSLTCITPISSMENHNHECFSFPPGIYMSKSFTKTI